MSRAKQKQMHTCAYAYSRFAKPFAPLEHDRGSARARLPCWQWRILGKDACHVQAATRCVLHFDYNSRFAETTYLVCARSLLGVARTVRSRTLLCLWSASRRNITQDSSTYTPLTIRHSMQPSAATHRRASGARRSTLSICIYTTLPSLTIRQSRHYFIRRLVL